MTSILDPNGAPISPATIAKLRRRATVDTRDNGGVAYEAGRYATQDMSDWHPWLWSPDTEINPWRDRIVARVRDLVRNDGWASGAITRLLDSAIGGDFKLVSTPDWRALAQMGAACDRVWADEFGKAAEALWRSWAYDPARYCDGARRLTIPQLFRLAFRHKLVDGEAFAVLLWVPERMGPGRAQYATALQIIDPDRLSNPELMFDTEIMRGGVEIDRYGAPIAYHIRRAHEGDWYDAAKSLIWDRLPRETEFGRPIVLHDFEIERAGQHRAPGGVLTPIVSRLAMLSKYDQTEMQAAMINAIFAAFIESPMDGNALQAAMGDMNEGWSSWQEARTGYYNRPGKSYQLGGSRVMALYPGEKLQMVNSTRPNTAFAEFESAILRNAASALGMTFEQLSQDWSQVNYSSARAALLEAWKTMSRRRQDFAAGFATPVYGAFLEEAFDRGELPLPHNAPDFIEARAAYTRCRWMGPPRGWVDPVKEAQAAVLRMDAGLTTLEQECAEQGMDWEDVLAQRAREVEMFKSLGLTLPDWGGGEIASKTERPQ
jgi:lambda family phage portal protein